MLVSENAKICVSPDAKHKMCVSPAAKPQRQWNIGCVGSPALGLSVGHVHFIFFVLISFALGSFQWNMGFTLLAGAGVVKALTFCFLHA